MCGCFGERSVSSAVSIDRYVKALTSLTLISSRFLKVMQSLETCFGQGTLRHGRSSPDLTDILLIQEFGAWIGRWGIPYHTTAYKDRHGSYLAYRLFHMFMKTKI